MPGVATMLSFLLYGDSRDLIPPACPPRSVRTLGANSAPLQRNPLIAALALTRLLSGSKSPATPPGYPPSLPWNPKGARAVAVSSVLLAPLEGQPNSLNFPKLFPRQKSSLDSPGPFLSFLCFCGGGCLPGTALALGQGVFSRGKKAYRGSCGLTNFNFLGSVLRTRGWRETQTRREKIRR